MSTFAKEKDAISESMDFYIESARSDMTPYAAVRKHWTPSAGQSVTSDTIPREEPRYLVPLPMWVESRQATSHPLVGEALGVWPTPADGSGRDKRHCFHCQQYITIRFNVNQV